jgi:hypothetical protein
MGVPESRLWSGRFELYYPRRDQPLYTDFNGVFLLGEWEAMYAAKNYIGSTVYEQIGRSINCYDRGRVHIGKVRLDKDTLAKQYDMAETAEERNLYEDLLCGKLHVDRISRPEVQELFTKDRIMWMEDYESNWHTLVRHEFRTWNRNFFLEIHGTTMIFEALRFETLPRFKLHAVKAELVPANFAWDLPLQVDRVPPCVDKRFWSSKARPMPDAPEIRVVDGGHWHIYCPKHHQREIGWGVIDLGHMRPNQIRYEEWEWWIPPPMTEAMALELGEAYCPQILLFVLRQPVLRRAIFEDIPSF